MNAPTTGGECRDFRVILRAFDAMIAGRIRHEDVRGLCRHLALFREIYEAVTTRTHDGWANQLIARWNESGFIAQIGQAIPDLERLIAAMEAAPHPATHDDYFTFHAMVILLTLAIMFLCG